MDVLLVVAAFLLLLGAGGVALTVLVIRATVRGACELGARARYASRRIAGGPRAELDVLRGQVVHSVAAVQACLDDAERVGTSVGDVPALLHQLRAAGGAVLAELQAMDRIADPQLLATRLPGTRAAVQLVRDGARDLCDGLLAAARERDGDLGRIRAACAAEAESLHEGVRSARLA